MAADYEHGRNSSRLMLTLLFVTWCGLTHTSLNISCVHTHGGPCKHNTYQDFDLVQKPHQFYSLAQKPDGLDKQKMSINCLIGHPVQLQNLSKQCSLPVQINVQKIIHKNDIATVNSKNFVTHCEAQNDKALDCNRNTKRQQHAFADLHVLRASADDDVNADLNETCKAKNEGPGKCVLTLPECSHQGSGDHASAPLLYSHWVGDGFLAKVLLDFIDLLNQDYISEKKYPWNHNFWTLMGFITLVSDIFHTVVAQEVRRRQVHVARRARARCNLVRAGLWAFVGRVALLLGLVWFAGVWGCCCLPPYSPFKLMKKPDKHKRAKFTKQQTNKHEKFSVQVDVFFHGIQKPLHVNHIVGDGNCYWRAVAKQTKYSWYRLKKLTLGYMKQYAKEHCDEALLHEAQQLSKKNAWANMLAVLGTAAFLQKDIRICTRQHIINCAPWPHDLPAPRGSRDVINLFFDKQHYSGVDAEDVRNRLAAVDQTLGCSLKEFTSIPINSYPEDKIVYRHRMNHHSKNSKRRRRRSVQSFTSRDSMTPKPKYRPAGPGPSGQRRPNESFEQQIARIVKAKSASIGAGNSSGSSGASPAKATPMIPTQPPGPPPGWRRPPTPPARPSRAPDLQITSRPLPPPPPRVRREENDEGERVPEPKTPPQTPPVINTGGEGLVHNQFRLREALICSGGQRFQWRTPGLSDNSVVLLEDLFHVKDNDPANRLYGHLGVHVQSMQKFARQPRFIESIVKQITAALSMESAILIYQCTSGRHRSVAAVQITKDVFQNLVPNARITTRHLSSHYWKPSTCGGECDECRIIINNPPVPYEDLVNQISQMVRERTGEAYMADCNCTGSRIARFVDLIGGFSDSAVSSVRCCLQHVKASIACQSSLPPLDVIRCHLVSGSSGSFWYKGGPKHYSPKAEATQLDAVHYRLGSASSRFFGFLGGFEHFPPKAETIQLDANNCRLGFARSGLFGSIGGFARPYSKAKANYANDDQTHRHLRSDGDRMPDVSASAYVASAAACQSLCSTKILTSKQTPKIITEKVSCNADDVQNTCYDIPKVAQNVTKYDRSECLHSAHKDNRILGFIAHALSCQGLLRIVVLVSMPHNMIVDSYLQTFQGGMLSFDGDENVDKIESKHQRKKCTQHDCQHECPTSFIATYFNCRGLLRTVVLISMLLNIGFTSHRQVLQGGMLNPDRDELRDELSQMIRDQSRSSVHSSVAPLEECANNILVGDCVCLENVKMLLDHPEAPFHPHGDGFQITLGAARLSLTKTSSAYPNFTRVMTTYMQQCNSKACGTTIAINKNMQTSLHTDSHNEKLPAYLTAITDFSEGEIFLKSDHGQDLLEGHKGFLMSIPVGNTIAIPTFKIPHATNYWKGDRTVMILFTSPLKRIDACRQNLRLQLQQLGFHIPEIDKSWVDWEITGNIQGKPICSRPTSIRGYFTTGERRCSAIQVQGDLGRGCVSKEICNISSDWEVDPNLDQTRTWTDDPFDSQISDIEHCEDEMPSPATTILDSDSELHRSDNNCANADTNRGRKRKNFSTEMTSSCHQQEAGDELRRSFDQSGFRVGYDGGYFGFNSEVIGDRSGMHSNSIYEIGDGTKHHEQSISDLFGFNNSEAAAWSISSDPIELCTDDEMNCPMSGGGAPDAEFQPNKTDISKLVQKLKNVKHGYAPKQIRMLLISDAKFFKKIDRTADTKQLQSCVAAAAQRMGLSSAVHETPQMNTTNNPASSSRQKPDVQSIATDKNPSGKGGITATQKGKGKGDISQNEQKGRGKGQKGKHAEAVIVQTRVTENATSKGKAKGKGKQSKITYSIDPDGWNVRPLTEFSNTHGGIYMCEKEEQAKHIAEKGVGRNYPIGILAPFPMDIGVKQPEQICVEFVKHYGDQNQKISMQAFLHQVTYVDVEYRKMAPAINIQKPSIAKTSVCYLTFSDNGACAQTQIEIEQKKIAAVKQWISSLVQHNRSLEILDVWNVQALQKQVNERIYQASVRVQSAQVESLLAMSGPGKLQVNVPGALRTNLQHIWLKKEGRPMTEDEVVDIMNEHAGQHLGAFQVRGTWALRMLADRHSEMKMKLGRNEDPAYFLSNVPPEMEAENIQEILQQLKWNATVKDGERRWKRAGYTWMVRSSEDPKVWQFPITFGYERRTLKIEAARKPKTITSPPVPANSVMHFPTWNAQSRIGKLQPRIQNSQPTFVDVVNAARKRHRPEVAPIQREDSENWSDIEENVPKQDDNGLKQQLQDMMKQNSEQQQTIQQLMQQIQALTAQVQALTAQNLAGGANNSGNVMPHPGNAS